MSWALRRFSPIVAVAAMRESDRAAQDNQGESLGHRQAAIRGGRLVAGNGQSSAERDRQEL